MSQQTRGKLSNQNCWKWSLCLCRRWITISLHWPFLSLPPSPHQLLSLSRRSAYWPFVKFDILFDQQDSSIDLWSISCIFGFVPNTQLHGNRLNCERQQRKRGALILTHHQRFASSHFSYPFPDLWVTQCFLLPAQDALRKLQNLLDLLSWPEIGCGAQPWSTLGMYAAAAKAGLWFVNDGFTFAGLASLSAAAAA